MSRLALAVVVLLTVSAALAFQPAGPIRVGSKNFTEQEILGEIVARLLERGAGATVHRRFGLGGTEICHTALTADQLDIYVEYTGTGLLNVLRWDVIQDPARAYLAVAAGYRDRYDLAWLPPIGFNNTYAITVRAQDARDNGWTRISDLAGTAGLRAGFTAEFMERPDGYPGLADAYGLEFATTVDLDPGLMYQAASDGQVDVICAFATDGRIAEYGLRTLEDDRAFFPPYDAAPVVRAELLETHPEVRDALALLAGAIADEDMRAMNHAVDVLRRDPAEVADDWVDAHLGGRSQTEPSTPDAARGRESLFRLAISRRAEIGRKTLRHLGLSAAGTSLAVLFAVPLGVLIHRSKRARAPALAATEILQTIPSLAMLAFLFALYGLLGVVPAVTALVLYALLPIVVNTFTGLQEVPRSVVEAANGVGMSHWQRLRIVELPLAAPMIIAGIRTAAVLTVGIATLSTYIGAGGLGDFIARGLARNDPRLTLLGALPAAALAVALSLAIRAAQRAVSRE